MVAGRHRATGVVETGFTLVELVVSLVIASVILIGLTSALVLATSPVRREAGPIDRINVSRSVVDQLTLELEEARWVTEIGERAVTFVVADRDGDDVPEQIRYAWSGVAGEPLTRAVNGGEPVPVLEDVYSFELTYSTRDVSEEYPGPPVEGAEIPLSSFTSYGGARSWSLKKDEWIGQYFAPSTGAIPADALQWRVTRLWLLGRAAGPGGGQTLVQVRKAAPDHKPTDTVMASAVLSEDELAGSMTFAMVTFSDSQWFAASEDACLVLENGDGGGESGAFYYRDNAGSGRLETKDAGKTWKYYPDQVLIHFIYGVAATPGPTQTATRRYVTGIRAAVQAGQDAAGRVDTAARLLNAPEVLSYCWELDFDRDPTVVDLWADGEADWVTSDGSDFDTGTLTAGVWKANVCLKTQPACNFDELTTVKLTMRDTLVDSGAAVVRLPVDRSGSQAAIFYVSVTLEASGTQTFTLVNEVDGNPVTLVKLDGFSKDFVTSRLLIDPDQDSINVRVAGVDCGTFSYASSSSATGKRIKLNPDRLKTGVEFDAVSIRVGGNYP